MGIEEFIAEPFGKKSIHEAYGSSFLHMRPAPEYASGEVVLASLHRNVGFSKTMEGRVPANGRQLLQRVAKKKRQADGAGFDFDTWQGILDAPLRSPKQPNQSTKRFLQLCPLVPDCSLYSSSARLTSNSWNPGQMIERMIAFGTPNQEEGSRLWQGLFTALSVSQEDDDPWARALNQELNAWRAADATWTLQPYEHHDLVERWRKGGGESSAGSFVADLEELLGLKTTLTRRQWVSMLESHLRLASSTHVLWLCKVNRECANLMEQALAGKVIPPLAELQKECLSVGQNGFWRYGQRAADTIRDYAREFVVARASLNLLLFLLDELGWLTEPGTDIPQNPLSSPASIHATAIALQQRHEKFPSSKYKQLRLQIMDKEPRLVSAKKGIGSNIAEFLRHCLGQRQTSEEGMKSYDQGFWLRKKGYYAAAPWIVSAGPVAVLLLAFCCTRRKVGPTTIDDLCSHLQAYGIAVRPAEVSSGDLGHTLRNMGLVTDSPDAEGGMLVRNPFEMDSEGDE